MDKKVINQQRALCLNGPGVIHLRQFHHEKKKQCVVGKVHFAKVNAVGADVIGKDGPPGQDTGCANPTCKKNARAPRPGAIGVVVLLQVVDCGFAKTLTARSY